MYRSRYYHTYRTYPDLTYLDSIICQIILTQCKNNIGKFIDRSFFDQSPLPHISKGHVTQPSGHNAGFCFFQAKKKYLYFATIKSDSYGTNSLEIMQREKKLQRKKAKQSNFKCSLKNIAILFKIKSFFASRLNKKRSAE